MHDSIFTQISLIISLAAGMALIMRLIKQPLIIGHILTGIIVGPTMFHLVKSPDTIEVFSNIGIALLLFIIGLGLNPKVIREVGKVATFAGLLQVGFSMILGWAAGIILGFTHTEAVFLGVALSFSSTIIILKLLNDKKEQTRLYGKIVTGILLIQDLLATVALLFATANSSGGGFSLMQVGVLAIKGVSIGVPLLLIGNFVFPKMHKIIGGSSEFLFLFAIGWGFGCAALFEVSGFSLEIGALLAGIALASLPFAQEISSRLRPLRDFFVIVFFISLGTRLAFGSILSLIPAIFISSIIVIIFKPIVVLIIMGFMGYTKQTSFKTAVSIGQISEFSLVFIMIGNRAGLVSNNLVVVITMVALISIATSSYMIIYADSLLKLLDKHLSMFEYQRNKGERKARHHYELVLFGYQKGGHEFLKVFQSMKKRYVVVDYDPDVIDAFDQQKIHYLYGDATDAELLSEIGLDHTRLIVSTISDHATNVFLMKHLEHHNSSAVAILHADTMEEAAELYELGASYVVIPHYIGSEKISAFIKRSGLKKSEFRKYREKHLAYLQTHFAASLDT